MNYKKFFFNFFLISALTSISYITYHFFYPPKKQQLFTTEQPQRRTIKYKITSTGILEIKNTYKIGCQLPGIIKELYVHENDIVKKGDILARIETGKEDKDVQHAHHNLERAKQEAAYQKAYFKRQKALFDAGQLAQNAFDKIRADYQKAREEENMAKINLEKTQLEYGLIAIKSPCDGFVTAVQVSVGASVMNDFQNILFEIAHNITQMKAIFDIDESDIGDIQPGLPVKIIINAFPEQPIIATLHEINYAPKGTKNNDETTTYKATVFIDNTDRRLRPGMRLTAHILVRKEANALSLSGMPFQINSDTMGIIAQQMKLSFSPISKEEKASFKKKHPLHQRKSVFLVHEQSITDQLVAMGINNTSHWHIIDGLDESDIVVKDIAAANELEKLYKDWFKGSL
ncbi:MAG: hypothetical protein US69_C0008G0028 [candidate division TM6 bacterium GW2011_GWF2_38_10]|nr:MAG: hypothetical protein US69_C0008G0028 [candidate division TM6 bacterium GW2011_GWF2_38_10]